MKRPLAAAPDDGLPCEQQTLALDSAASLHVRSDGDTNDDPAAKRQRLTMQALGDTNESHVLNDTHEDVGENAVNSPDSNTVFLDLQLSSWTLFPAAFSQKPTLICFGTSRPENSTNDVDGLIKHRERPTNFWSHFFEGYYNDFPHALLRASYSDGCEPVVLRVNRQVHVEFVDFMHKMLTFQADIFANNIYEDREWHLGATTRLQICSKISTDRELLNLSSLVKFVRKMALRVWIPRKVAQAPNNSTEPSSVSGRAKNIKEHLNRLVVALIQVPCLKSVDVRFQLHRQRDEPTPYMTRINLDPLVLADTEIADSVACILEVCKENSTISDTLAGVEIVCDQDWRRDL
ncbi:Peroxisomal catalase [Venturia nashicola]|nr:Peroxisomal catalase [Venturia nashicola]